MSQFRPEDSVGTQTVISNQDIVLASDRDQTGAGDIIFQTGGVERARIKYNGTGSGWSSFIGSVAVFNVKDAAYGAKGDGATDDTAAIQAALTACAAAGGGIVCVPPGNYKTTTALSVPAGVFLVGAGVVSVILAAVTVANANTGNKSAVSIGRGASAGLQALVIDGGHVTEVGLEISGYNDGQIQNFVARDVEIRYCTQAGIKLQGGYRMLFEHLNVHDNQIGIWWPPYASAYLATGASQIDFVSCWVQTNAAENVLMQSGGQVNFDGGNIEHAGTYGVHINPTGGTAGPFSFDDVNFEQNGDYVSGVGLIAKTLTRGLTVKGCQFIGNAFNAKQWKAYDVQAGAGGVVVEGGNVQGHAVSPTIATGTATTVIEGAGDAYSVGGNYPTLFARATGSGVAEVSVDGNDVDIELRLTPKGAGVVGVNGPLKHEGATAGFFGHAPAAQQARPVTLADVINLLVAYGLSA